MKLDKKKLIFSGVLALVLVFMVGYYYLVIANDGDNNKELEQTTVPELEEEQHTFSSKKDAIDALEDKKQRNAPSIYDERLLDSTGLFDPDLLGKERQLMVDSIYRLGRIDYSKDSLPRKRTRPLGGAVRKKTDSIVRKKGEDNSLKAMALEQQLFFAISPNVQALGSGEQLEVEVDGEQTIKVNDRLQMRVLRNTSINGIKIQKNTILYGIVKFRPNRVVLEIENIDHTPLKLVAFDLADGLEGIYIKNSFRGDVFQEVLGDVVEDINIPGVPQVSGIKKMFQRNNRNVRVTVNNNYKLILAPKGH